jgi:alginate O-acetyltransferase complex protein AlgI
VLFTQPSFLFLFLPVLLALYFCPAFARRATVRPARAAAAGAPYHNLLLVAASILFYAKGGGSFTLLILALIAFTYVMALGIDRHRDTRAARALLWTAVAVDLLVLAIFKYADFVVTNANTIGGAVGLHAMPLPRVLLPIGISFFTFHAISYVVDVHRRDATAQKSPVEAALYLLLFPQLIAGPIVRYREIASQLRFRDVSDRQFAGGATRFVVGLAKKVLIANTVAVAADAIFGMPVGQLTAAHAWLGIVCYTLQIYFDFSGYSDMAIGLGAMFGFRFPENFNYPYIASSVQDFWRRWHMSLSRWFRDYVYVPLGGNRVSSARTYVNLVAVFFLCGLWHGASWTFVVWGLYHGAFLVIERVLASAQPAQCAQLEFRATGAALRGTRIVRHAYVVLVVMVGWVFFRADTFVQAIGFLKAMAGFGGGVPAPVDASWYLDRETILAIAAGVIGSTPAVAAAGRWLEGSAPAVARSVTVGALFAASVLFIAAHTYNPFIYFRF